MRLFVLSEKPYKMLLGLGLEPKALGHIADLIFRAKAADTEAHLLNCKMRPK